MTALGQKRSLPRLPDLRNAAQLVLGEHLRAKTALTHLYPDIA